MSHVGAVQSAPTRRAGQLVSLVPYAALGQSSPERDASGGQAVGARLALRPLIARQTTKTSKLPPSATSQVNGENRLLNP